MINLDNNDISNYIDSIIEKKSFIDIGVLLEKLDEGSLDIIDKTTLLNKANQYNLTVIKQVLKENKDLKENNYDEMSNDLISTYEPFKEKTINRTIQINIQNLYQMIKTMTSSEEISTYLKKSINPDKYTDTINCLIAYLIEEKVTIKKLQNEEYLKNKTNFKFF